MSRILIADSSNQIIQAFQQAFEGVDYELKVTSNGKECLELVDQFKPDLVIVDQLLPQLHGIELLKKIKARPDGKKIGVILSTWRALIQDYRTAIENGAIYYLLKPFSTASIHRIVQRFFEGKLEPAPFPLHNIPAVGAIENYNPSIPWDAPYIKFWGTRGSTPVSGPEYLFFGGNTPCLEISPPDSMIIIDAGTGIRALGDEVLHRRVKDIHLFLSHTHWDHILGFPFFMPVYSREHNIHIYAPKGFGKHIDDLFKGMLSRDYFPVKFDEIQAKIFFHDLDAGEEVSIGSVKMQAAWASHPGATLCFKIKIAGKTIGYATDNEVLVGYHGHPKEILRDSPLLAADEKLIQFYSDCDILVHEAQYSPQEYRHKVGWGHSSLSNAAAFVKQTGVKHWIITHHDPGSTDNDLHNNEHLATQILSDCGYECSVQVAYDGLSLLL